MSDLTIPENEHDHILGSLKAPEHLVEYGDYECPYCGQAYYVLKTLLPEEGDRVGFVFRNFPLIDVHPHAFEAAKAAEAAGMQDKFWEMHDMLFEHQDALTEYDLFSYAENLQLDMDKFGSDFISPAVFDRIQNDIDGGSKSGVEGTPTFFINLEMYHGPDSVAGLKMVLEHQADHPLAM